MFIFGKEVSATETLRVIGPPLPGTGNVVQVEKVPHAAEAFPPVIFFLFFLDGKGFILYNQNDK